MSHSLKRQERLASLARAGTFDLAVVGAGASGLGVALDAALRGFSVVLFDSHDFAGGTSSRSTKLLHGGVRYLAQGNLALVREALEERSIILNVAPHLAQPLPFVMPSYAWWQTPFYGAGLKLYDLMAGQAGLGPTEVLGRQATLRALPGVRSQGLKGGVRYWDGQFDDARLALALARSAEAAGARVMNHVRVESVQQQASGQDGSIRFQLKVSDRFTGGSVEVSAGCVVNATGVWVDELRRQAAPPGKVPAAMVSPSQGVHVVIDQDFLPGSHALLVPRTRDGRVLFAVPWLGKLILGTTDTPRQDLPREPEPFAQELRFILDESAGVLQRTIRTEDIRSIWVGLRPLVAPPGESGGATKSISREHTIVVDPNGLVTVTGGKWTTYRAMAEDVLDRCMASGWLPRRPGGKTAGHRLCGAPLDDSASVPIYRRPGLHLYGAAADDVLACPGAGRELGMGLTEAMVRHAVRCEHACTVEDVLARRWRALFLDARQASAMAPQVARILEDEGVQYPELDAFLALCQHYLPSPSIDRG